MRAVYENMTSSPLPLILQSTPVACVESPVQGVGRKPSAKNMKACGRKKRSSVVDPDRLKQEIKDDIFATLRAAGIDVEAALLAAAHGKSSCASKEVEQQDLEAAATAFPNPPPPVYAAC